MSKKIGDPTKIKKMTHASMPATVQLINEVRDELKADIGSVRHELKAEIRVLDGKISEIKSDIQQVLSSVHRSQTLMEEQRSENRIVLDGLKTVNERQDRFELEFRDVQKTIGLLARR